MSCHIHRHRQHTTYIHVGASPLDINLYFFQGCPMTAHNPRRKDYQRDAFDAVLLILNKWILSNICLFHLPEGSQPISKKILRLAGICIFHLFEVPRDPVLVPMSTGTTQMMCTCFEINEIFNFFMRKIQSELFRKSTCVTILLFACFGTDKSHSHLSGLKLWANSDSDSMTISRRKLLYFAAVSRGKRSN